MTENAYRFLRPCRIWLRGLLGGMATLLLLGSCNKNTTSDDDDGLPQQAVYVFNFSANGTDASSFVKVKIQYLDANGQLSNEGTFVGGSSSIRGIEVSDAFKTAKMVLTFSLDEIFASDPVTFAYSADVGFLGESTEKSVAATSYSLADFKAKLADPTFNPVVITYTRK